MPQCSNTDNFFHIPWTAGIQEFSLQLVVQWKGEWWNAGSAILIGDRLALSAKHIIEFIYTHIVGNSIPTGIPDYERTGYPIVLPEGCGMNAVQTIDSGKSSLQWSVSKLYPVGYKEVDLILLSLTAHPDQAVSPGCKSYKQKKLPRLWLYPPAVGQIVDAFGFPDHEQHSGGNLPNGSLAGYLLYRSKGEVVHINSTLENRQASHLSFTSTAETKSGMSGGPVALSKPPWGNFICGVVSRSRSFANESLATPLWPILGTKVFRDDAELGNPGKYSILELAKAGIVNAPSADHFSLRTIRREPNGDGTFTETVLNGEPAEDADPGDLEIEIVCAFPELQRQGTLLGSSEWIDGLRLRMTDIYVKNIIKREQKIRRAESVSLFPNLQSVGEIFRALLDRTKTS